MGKKLLCIFFALLTVFAVLSTSVYAANASLLGEAKSVILIEAETGKILYENNADEKLLPASVTKIMTLLLVMEAIDRGTIKLTDTIQVSENAASMGGSQVYLEPGEEISVEDLLKSVIIASANDAAVTLCEYVAGSEESFIEKMNKRAAELGMTNTFFENATGLDDDTVNHLTTARDISAMSRELLKHKTIFDYTTIWMDSIRNGEFGLTNTNRLIRFYNGANGLKTGSTSKAKFCISATAKRDGMQLIAVVMAAPTRDVRNEIAKKLLDYGFANYKYICYESAALENIRVLGGVKSECGLIHGKFDTVLDKSASNIETVINLPEYIAAPVKSGDIVGSIEYKIDGVTIGTAAIMASENIKKISYWGLLERMLEKFFLQ